MSQSPWRTYKLDPLDEERTRSFFLWPERFREELATSVEQVEAELATPDPEGGAAPDWSVLASGFALAPGPEYETQDVLLLHPELQTRLRLLDEAGGDVVQTISGHVVGRQDLEVVSAQEDNRVYVIRRQYQKPEFREDVP